MLTPFSNDGFIPGNYAIVISCPAVPEMIMKMVRLEVCIPFGESRTFTYPFTNATDPAEPAWIVTGNDLLRRRIRNNELVSDTISCFGQSCLMPIKPDADPLTYQTEVSRDKHAKS